MVQVSVNLLKNRHILSEKDYQREQSLLRYSVLSLVIVVFITVAVSIWNFWLSRRLVGIESAIASSSQEMKGLAEANAQQVYLKSRLKLIASFLDERSISRESLQSVFSLNIPGATITSVSFVSDTIISLQITSNSVATLNEVIGYYQGDNTFFTQVLSRGIARTKEGMYDLRLELTIPKGTT
jgi:hypothetical protein